MPRFAAGMAESTGVDEARTLHSALGLGTGEEIGDGERVRTVDADLIIVDEFSMVDMWLAQQFFKRIGQHTRVVLVGDPNQLPSVGAGNVFYELIHSGMVPVTVLDWIFRQSKDGLIAYNAKFINEGSTKLYYGNDFVFVDSPTQIETARRIQDIYCKEAAERGIENVQILSPFREKGEAASEQLNRAIRERVNPFRSAEEEVKIGSRTFRVHDRVMQTNDEKPMGGGFGGDVPDELCYQWAREYFRDADAKEDAEPEEKFVPKTYNGKVSKADKVKKDKPKKAAPKPAPKPVDEEQLTFGDFGTEEAAG